MKQRVISGAVLVVILAITLYFGVHHVGIYIGGNRMVHAPSSGKPVQVASLANSYWQRSFYQARRCY